MSIYLDPIFSDSMILQREMPVPVWGTAEPCERVTVVLQGVSASAVADAQGTWHCELPRLTASDAEVLVVEGEGGHIEVSDVAIGEVFIAGGQSNMEFWMRYERHLNDALRHCENPRIRFYDMPKCSYPNQLEDFDFSETRVWRKASKAKLERFSAIGYYFARELEAQLDVPVGIVGCNYGGTRSCAWMTPEHAYEVQRPQVEAFINDWRAAWHSPDLPFLVVQLPGYRTWQGVDAHDWATIRTAQQHVADAMDKVWLCSIGDVGEELDIHPKDKRTPGHRLALLALRHLYGQDILADAPRCTRATAVDGGICLTFENVGEGLAIRGERVNSLEIRTRDGQSLSFEASTQFDKLNIRLAQPPNGDVEILFAQDSWHIINLVNSANIPALPFVAVCQAHGSLQ